MNYFCIKMFFMLKYKSIEEDFMDNLEKTKKINFLDRYFHISERGSTIGRELIGGLIVFLAMIYILPVNTNILSTGMGISSGAVFAATAICSAACTIFMGIFAKFPVALSAGMGMNTFIAFTVCGILGYTWGEALTLIVIAGILFFILTLTPLREKIINAIPKSLKLIISAGLGAFICFVGLKMGGIIQADSGTFVKLGNLTSPTVLLTLFGILLVLFLLNFKNPTIKKLAIVIAMAATAIIGVILGLLNVEGMPTFSTNNLGNISEIKETFGTCFKVENLKVLGDFRSYAIIFSLIFVNLFDTTATLLAVGKDAKILDENGQMIGGKKAMLADAGGAIICGILGTSTVTSFAESTIGVESGARTGLCSTFTGILFGLTLLIYPAFSIFAPVQINSAGNSGGRNRTPEHRRGEPENRTPSPAPPSPDCSMNSPPIPTARASRRRAGSAGRPIALPGGKRGNPAHISPA